MYLFESTEKEVSAERLRLNSWQADMLTVRNEDGARQNGVFSMGLRGPALLRAVGVPFQLVDFTIETMPDYQREIYDNVINTAFGEGVATRIYTTNSHGLALMGVASTGKTSLSSAVLRRAAKEGFTIKFIDLEAFSKFHTTWIELSSNGDKYDDYADRADSWRAELWRMYEVYEFLVLDDAGRSKVPLFVREEIHTLIRTRTANGCYTIVTGNFPTDQADQYLGESAAAFMRREFKVYGLGAARRLVEERSNGGQ